MTSPEALTDNAPTGVLKLNKARGLVCLMSFPFVMSWTATGPRLIDHRREV